MTLGKKDEHNKYNNAEKSDNCHNCGAPLYGEKKFCSSCGQENTQTNVPLSSLLGELIEGFFNVDSKFIRTLRVIFTRPGQIVNEFNAGKRMAYVPPLRLYFSVSVVFFLLLSVNQQSEVQKMKDSQELKKIQKKSSKSEVFNINILVKHFSFTRQEIDQIPRFDDRQIDSLIVAKGQTPDAFSRMIIRQTPKMMTVEGVNRLVDTLMNYISLSMFLLMPVFGGLLALFYIGQRLFYVQHLVHSIYLHCVFFMLFSLAQAVDWAATVAVGNFAFLAGLVYSWFSLRRVYGQGWLATTLKLLGLTACHLAILTAFMTVLVLLSMALL
jgi:hypothetical protein